MNKKTPTGGSSKKDLRARLSAQLHIALAEFKEAVHEKKLQKLVKKAAKLLAEGLHHNKPASKRVSKKAQAPKVQTIKAVKPPAKKAAPKKTAKKAAPKKTARKK